MSQETTEQPSTGLAKLSWGLPETGCQGFIGKSLVCITRHCAQFPNKFGTSTLRGLLLAISLIGCRPTPIVTPTPTPAAPQLFPQITPISPDNINQLELLGELGIGQVIDVVVSPDQQMLAVYTVSGIYLYDSATLSEQGFLEVRAKTANALTFSPNGDELVFSNSTLLTAWDVTTQSTRPMFFSEIPSWQVSNIDYSPDGNRMVVTTEGTHTPCDSTGINFALYNLEGDLLFDRYYCAAYTDYFYRFTDEGNLIFVFSSIMTDEFPLEVYVIDPATGTVLASAFKQVIGYEEGYTETQSGSLDLLPSPDALDRWLQESEAERADHVIENQCSSLNTESYRELYRDEDTATFVVSHRFSSVIGIEQWDLSRCTVQKEIYYPSANDVRFSPDGRLLAAGSSSVYVWDVQSMTLHFTVQKTPTGDPVDVFAFNADGTHLLTGTYGRDNYSPLPPFRDYTITVWDAQTGAKLREIAPQGEFLKFIEATSDPNTIVALDSNGLNLWNLADGQLTATLPSDSGAFAVDPNNAGIWLPVKEAENLQRITLYSIQTGEVLRELPELAAAWVSGLQINEDSTLLQVSYRNEPRIQDEWSNVIDLNTGETLRTTLNEDSTRYITTSDTHRYIGEYYRGPQSNNVFQAGEVSYRNSFELVSNQHFSVTWQGDTYHFWDVPSGRYLGEIHLFAPTRFLSLSPTNHFFAVVGTDGIIRILGIGSH